eukprot:scaffold6037_cov50-Cyclotella_meneghiniana.AAC.1
MGKLSDEERKELEGDRAKLRLWMKNRERHMRAESETKNKKKVKPKVTEKMEKKRKREEEKIRMELESKDWRLQPFDETSQVVHVNGTQGVYVCTRSKPGCGACCYAVCQDCYIRAFGGETSRNKRIRNVVISPNAEKHNRCRHELHNLEFESDLWWCDPKEERGLFTWDWMYKVKGCVSCNNILQTAIWRKDGYN